MVIYLILPFCLDVYTMGLIAYTILTTNIYMAKKLCKTCNPFIYAIRVGL